MDTLTVLERGRADPAWWCQQLLGSRLWLKQRDIVRDVHAHRKTAVRSCHAAGKTFLAANATISFLALWPRSIVITTATTHRQVKGVLWKEMHRLHRDARFPLGGRMTETALTMAPDWFALGFTSKENDATKFQGYHAHKILVVLDEAAGVSVPVFEGLDSVLSSGDGHMLAIGNPTTAQGEFGAMNKRADVRVHAISAFDTPNFTEAGITLDDIRTGAWAAKARARPSYPTLCTPAWVAEKWRQWGETDPRFMSRVLGQFPAQDETSLHPEVWIDTAVDRWRDIDEADGWRGEIDLGCDVARLGGDSTQIAECFAGLGVRRLIEEPPQDTMKTARAIATHAEHAQDSARVRSVRIDMDGLGAGIYDRVQELLRGRGINVLGVRNGTSAIDKERYFNARSELHYQLREAIDPGKDQCFALPPDEELKTELMAHKWSLTKRGGQIAVSSKDDIKATLGRSPDRADACAYAVGTVSGERDIELMSFAMPSF